MSDLGNNDRRLLRVCPVSFIGRDKKAAQALVEGGLLRVENGVYRRTKAGDAALAEAAVAAGKAKP